MRSPTSNAFPSAGAARECNRGPDAGQRPRAALRRSSGTLRTRPSRDQEAPMQLQMKGKNVDLTPALKAYAEKKLGRLGRHLNDSARVELELAAERNPSGGDSQIAEATVWTRGPVLGARESARGMKAAIDLLVDKLDRQAQRLHDNRRRRAARASANHAAPPATEEEG